MKRVNKSRVNGSLAGITNLIVFLLVAVMALSVATPAVMAMNEDTELEKVEQSESDVNIDEDLSSSEGDLEVLIHLQEYRNAVKSDGQIDVNSLKDYSAETQQPVVHFAENRDGVSLEEQFWLSNMAMVTVNTNKVSLDELARIEGVESLTKNFKFTLHESRTQSPTNSISDGFTRQPQPTAQYDTTYGIQQINATSVWDQYGTQGSGSLVTVLDTGVDADHPDINLNKWAEFDESGSQVGSNPYDMGSHGTHVSGTVSGGNSSGTYIGVAPDVTLNHGKVFQSDGLASFAAITSGMQWAVDNNSDVVSMSLGGEGYYDSWIDPVQNAESSGTLVVASIGNSGEGTSAGPGNVYDATSVGATHSNEDVVNFSSGELIDTSSDWNSPPTDWPAEYTVPTVSAPGYFINSSTPGGDYGLKNGTSMAAPHVSGAVALILSATGDSASPKVINQLLESTAYKPDSTTTDERDNRYGSGIIDVYEATQTLENPIEIQSINSSDKVGPNETLSVDYTLNNQIARSETESSVDLVIDGVVEDSDSDVSISKNGQKTGTLEFTNVNQYQGGDTINYTVKLSDNGDTLSGQSTVEEVANFEVEIRSINTPIKATNDLNVDVSVNNTGNVAGTQDIQLQTQLGNDTYEDLDLSSGQDDIITLTVGTEFSDSGTYTALVSSNDDENNAQFGVEEPKIFYVEVVDKVEPVEGNNVSIDVSVTSTKNSEQTQDIETTFGAGDTTPVTLAPDKTKTVNLQVPTKLGDAGTYTTELKSQDYSTQLNLEVHVPKVGNSNNYPNDVDSDGLYEDVDGDGQFGIFDVQKFFQNFEEPEITDYAHAYDFDGDSDIDIFDVQVHFQELS